ncbi:MAG: flavocytochrome c [Tissierellia bacterium]|nr:flavocytochrome c [Tissierellia bacterium]
MKRNFKIICLVLIAIMVFTACSTTPEKPEETTEGITGSFEGVGKGRGGDIKISLSLKDSTIEAIEVLEHSETPGYESSFEELTNYAVGHNQVPTDVVSGATLASNGFIDAIKDALKNAGLDAEALVAKEVEKSDKETIEETVDVVVVGAGGAGLTAAIRAKEAGANVMVFEKLPFVGGNTLISGAEYAAPGNWIQEKEGIEDNTDLFYEDVLKAGGNPELVRTLADNALDGAIWLRDDAKVQWEDELMFFGGHTVKRSLIPAGASGKEIITKLSKKAEELGIRVEVGARVTELILDGDKVVGVKAEGESKDYIVNSKSVVLSTGGFGSNVEMRVKYNPEIDDSILSTNSPGSTGDGIILAQSAGAVLVGMEHIQLYPICDPLTGTLLYVDDTRLYQVTIMVNKEGQRFVEELDTRYAISMAMKAQSDGYGYELWDQAGADLSQISENHPAEIQYLKDNGLLVVAETLDECAEHFGIDKEALKATVEKWNGYVDAGADADFNKRGTLHKIETGPFWMIKAVPAVHHTMGGVSIDKDAQVLREDGTIIPGLFAAGEVTGGIHGDNRLGSAAIADITVFGIIAGDNAAKYSKE